MAARERVEFDVVGRDAGGSKAFRDVGDAAAKAADQIDDVGKTSVRAGDQVETLGDKVKATGDKTEGTGEKYRGLAHDIEQVEGNVRRLASEIDRTGNKELFKDLRKQQGELRKLIRVKDLLPDDSESHDEAVRFGGRLAENVASGLSRAGGPVSGALSKVFGTLPPQAQVAIGAGIVAAGAAAAPGLAAVVSGAIVGAAGAGGIVGGIAIAARHPQVKASATLTGEVFAETMQRAGVSFVPATLDALGQVRSRIGDMEGDLERAFSATSRFLPGLTDHFLDGAERAVEGFATAAERAGPVIDAIGQIGERVGDMLADTFEGLSEHSSEGAHALLLLWGVFEYGIRSIAGTIEMLTATYGWLEKIGAFLAGDVATLGRLVAEQEAAKGSSGDLSSGLQDLLSSFEQTSTSVATATAKVESFNDMVKRLASENLTAEQANIRLEEAIDRATEAGKRNNAGIDVNTAKGRENRKALLDIASAASTSADAIFAQTGSQELASAATERGRAKFLEAARAMGVEKGEAKRLADQLFGIPKKVDTKIMVRANTQPAIDNARSVVARINAMHARIRVSAEPSGGYGGSAHTGDGYSTGYSAGGYVDGPGPKGVDSRLAMLAPGEGVLTAREIDALGGRAGFTQLRAAIRGQTSAPAPMLAATPSRGRAAGADEEALYRAFVRALRTVPVARDAGRVADIYTRGG